MRLKKKRVYTEEQKARHREYCRNLAEYRRENRLCLRCGKPIELPTGNYCQRCKDYKRQRSKMRTKIARVTGKCVICKKRYAIPHMRICLECKTYYGDYYAANADKYSYANKKSQRYARRKRYIEEGRCSECGHPTDGIHIRCPKCLERARLYQAKRRMAEKNASKANA